MKNLSYRSVLTGIFTLWAGCFATGAALADCSLSPKFTFTHEEIGELKVFSDPDTKAIAFASQMQVNTDGAPDSYHPDDIGITHICNGVSVGANCTWKPKCLTDFNQAKAEHFKGPTKICFFAMATDAKGIPIIQGPTDPKAGYFVSTTALHQPGENLRTPQAQLDSNTVNFAVIPGNWQRSGNPGPKLGDFGVAYRRSNGKSAFFVIGAPAPKTNSAKAPSPCTRRSGMIPSWTASASAAPAKASATATWSTCCSPTPPNPVRNSIPPISTGLEESNCRNSAVLSDCRNVLGYWQSKDRYPVILLILRGEFVNLCRKTSFTY
ncbi:hypothetical protein [Methylomonas sp. 11b]|uniref:hypothetical protein n=1 Tax=Methylomonas sp. 11b TaxID=1168169 RepID=UPI0004B0C96A|nr:hypothetical protein [Methylomonas sp. 11b]